MRGEDRFDRGAPSKIFLFRMNIVPVETPDDTIPLFKKRRERNGRVGAAADVQQNGRRHSVKSRSIAADTPATSSPIAAYTSDDAPDSPYRETPMFETRQVSPSSIIRALTMLPMPLRTL